MEETIDGIDRDGKAAKVGWVRWDMAENRLRSYLLELDKRRRDLKMPLRALARRSQVPRSTVQRLLSGETTKVSLDKVAAVAEALGVEVVFAPAVSAEELTERQARKKAQEVVDLVQGTMALEAQAVNSAVVSQMFSSAYTSLLKGPRKKLWFD